ncbi:MAG: hypothetical protein Q9166_000218 [cf. Caloplaca sp. 2 TL-2023]
MRYRGLSPSWTSVLIAGRPIAARNSATRRTFSSPKSASEAPDDILPNQPTWSLQDLFENHSLLPEPQVSEKELHHLLRLSALPLPKDLPEQHRMQKDLQSQLKFVKAIQKIEIPDLVKPLQSIRDETEEGMREQEITAESLKDEFAKEEVVGIRGRIRRREGVMAVESKEEKWDPLVLAPRTVGRYVVVNTAKD